MAQLGRLKSQGLESPTGLFTHKSGTWAGGHLVTRTAGGSTFAWPPQVAELLESMTWQLGVPSTSPSSSEQGRTASPITAQPQKPLSPRSPGYEKMSSLQRFKERGYRLPQEGGAPRLHSRTGGRGRVVAAFGKYPQPRYTRSLCKKSQIPSPSNTLIYTSVFWVQL